MTGSSRVGGRRSGWPFAGPSPGSVARRSLMGPLASRVAVAQGTAVPTSTGVASGRRCRGAGSGRRRSAPSPTCADLGLLDRRSAPGPAGSGCGTGSRSAGRAATGRSPVSRPLCTGGTVGVGHRDRPQQGRRVGVGRRGVEVVGRADLADLAEVHHRHPVADVLHHGEVVGDEDQREAVARLHVLEQVEDLGLHRHVEGRDRLVADDQLRVEHERPGDRDALALAAGELVGPLVGGDRRGRGRRRRAPRRPGPSARRRCRASRCAAARRRCRSPCGAGSATRSGPGRSTAGACGPRAAPGRSRAARSAPSKSTLPLVGGGSCMIARPVVDLPQPDSPTRPSVSPSRTSRLMPETAWTVAAADGRELDDEVLDAQQRRRRSRRWAVPVPAIRPALRPRSRPAPARPRRGRRRPSRR